MSVVVSVIFGFILLVAVTFVVPNDKDASAAWHLHRHLHLADVDEHALGRDPALHRGARAGLLHDRLGDLGLADDVRVLA